jgi:D-proline reductase (dithiol) PrdB
MPRLDQLSEIHRRSALFFPCLEHDDTPWTPVKKPLSQSKVAMVSTAGLHLRGDRLFQGGDPSYRVIPSDAKPADVILSHVSIGFDYTGIYRDLNLAFPLDRLRELAQQGKVGSLAHSYYSFMGAQRDPSQIIEETGPEAAALMHGEGVDLVLLSPV